MTQPQRLYDSIAIGASALCLVHCLLLPMAMLLVPTLAALLTIPESFHAAVFAIAVPTSLAALWLGYRRHRFRRPALLAAIGLALLGAGLLAALSERAETALTVLGSILLALGHVQNWGALRACAVRMPT